MEYTYHHGGDIYSHPGVLDFSVNINPLGMPREAREAAIRSIDEAGRYPDWKCRGLTKTLTEYYENCGVLLREEKIVWGNGAAELIYALCELIMLRRKHLYACIPAPTFSAYEEAVHAVGGELIEDPEHADLIFICNPNNPTGTFRDRECISRLADLCRKTDAFLCVDESFMPFTEHPETESAVCFQSKNVLVLRSLTKIYAMPGLRLGYLTGSIAPEIRAILQPWNLSVPAQAAGDAALKNRKFLERTRTYIRKEKIFLLSEMPETIVKISCESEANFIFFESEEDLSERLLKRGIMIRSCKDIRGLSKRHFRIGIRTHEENLRLVRVMREL